MPGTAQKLPSAEGLSENKIYLLRAGILTDGEKRARRISEVICNERATKSSVKRPSGKGKGHFSATPELHVLDYQRSKARLARGSTPAAALFIMHKGA
jgi:hypothetical protein